MAALLVMSLGLSTSAAGQSADSGGIVAEPAAAAIPHARALAEALREEASLPGLAIAIGVDDELVLSDAYGVANLETGAPATTVTRWRIGSVSKSLTAAGALVLSERGQLDLDAPVAEILPGWQDRPAAAATARQLAGHLGGIRHYREGEGIRYVHYGDVLEAVEIFADDSLAAPPGVAYGYSTYGYVLLSALIQQAARAPFLDWMRREVFRPLGLRNTGPDLVTTVVPGRASFYRIKDGHLRPAPSGDDSYKWAGGGLLSTPEDLVRFGNGLLAGRLLSPGGVERLFATQRTSAGEETGYGMGFRPDRDERDRRTAHHGGSSSGGRAFLLLYPDDALVMALTANRATAPLFEEEAIALAHFFLEHGGGTDARVDGDLAGEWRVGGTLGDDAVTGTLLLYSGVTTRGVLDWREGSSPIRIVVADRHGEELLLFGAGAHGVMRMWLEQDPQGWTGRWDYLGQEGRIELRALEEED